MLRELSQREIEYVAVGGTAAVLHGAPVVTADVDIVHLSALPPFAAVRINPRRLFSADECTSWFRVCPTLNCPAEDAW